MSFRDAAIFIEQVANDIPGNASRELRRLSLLMDQAIVLATPVDTGRARSNWLVSTGAPRTDVIEPYAPGEGLGLSEGANARGAINQGMAALAGNQIIDTVYISNNLPYIGPLNEGTSAQAPEMFVEIARDAALAQFGAFRILNG